MNNTRRRTLAIVVLIFTAATLVVGATTTQSASAYLQKKVAQHYDKGKHNWKGNGNTDTDTIQKCKQFASGFDPTFGDQNCDILSNSTISQAAETPVTPPTPEPTTTTLRIIKQLVCLPTDPNCSLPDFCIIVLDTSSQGSQRFTCQSAVGKGVLFTLQPGDFFVIEIEHSGPFAIELSGDCSGTIAAGQHLTCTITNTQLA